MTDPKATPSLIERLRAEAKTWAVPLEYVQPPICILLIEAADALAAAEDRIAELEKSATVPCTDAREQGYGCWRAVEAESRLAAIDAARQVKP